MNPGHHDVAAVLDRRTDGVDVLGLDEKVQLLSKRAGEALGQVSHVVVAGQAGARLRGAGQLAEDVEVTRDERLDTGSLDLDDHLLAGRQPRAMGLPDRGRGERCCLEPCEDLPWSPAQLPREQALDVGGGRWGHTVL
jgi:hypothetical protein